MKTLSLRRVEKGHIFDSADHLGGFSFRKRRGVDVTGLDSSVFGFG